MKATSDAVKLFHEGIIALSQVESVGICIDVPYLERMLKKTTFKIKNMEAELRADPIFAKWKKRFGDKTKLGSHSQLETVIFDVMGHKRTGRTTEGGSHAADEAAFEFVKEPFVKTYFEIEKLKKTNGTYLTSIQRELNNGRIYPMLDLHTTLSYRSSSSRPNIQNFPIRNPVQGKIIRRCIVAPKGFVVGELDYSGIEVRGAACYNKDPALIKYIEDPTTDMHRDMAMQCYKLTKEEVSKDARYCAKNRFVFPEFYGSYYVDCAKALWEAIPSMKLQTVSGLSLKKHLRQQGIISYKQFEEHIQAVEKDFWGRRFRVYDEWKREAWENYIRRGWFKFKTGFFSQELLNRKQVCNYPIQGSSFHCLLWSLIRLQNWIAKHKLKSRIIFEIHDSMGLYLHQKEIDDVLHKAREIMTQDILNHWGWIIVPLEVEAEVAPMGGSWFDKQPKGIN